MAWRPAIPDEYGKYFSTAELAMIYRVRYDTFKTLLNRVLEHHTRVLRIYYKPTGRGVHWPEATFHLEDVLREMSHDGLTVPPEWIEDVTVKHSIKGRRWRARGIIGVSPFSEKRNKGNKRWAGGTTKAPRKRQSKKSSSTVGPEP